MLFDLHIHSEYSHDCGSRIIDVLQTAKKKGLDGIAIMDHNTVQGYLKAKPIAKKMGIKLVPGYELETSDGDLLIYGITKVIEPFKTAEESVKTARKLGAVVVAAHPFDLFRKGVGELIEGLRIHGVEVANSHCFDSRRAKAFAVRKGLAQVGGSDAHICAEIGNAYTLCDEDPLTSIRKGRCSAIGGLNIKSLPLAVIHSVLMVPKKLRERVKRWKSLKQRKTK